MYISILFQPFCSYKCVLWKHHSAKIVLIFSRLTAFLKISFRLCCCCCCKVASVVSDSVWPQRWQPTRLPPSLGFSRQEHWSGVPFPSPMHESEKWKWSRSVVSNSVTPWTTAHQAPPSMGFSRQEYRSGVPLPSLLLDYKSSLFLVFEINLNLLLPSYFFNFYLPLLFHASFILLPHLSVLFSLWSSFWIDWGYVCVHPTFPFITFTSLESKAP